MTALSTTMPPEPIVHSTAGHPSVPPTKLPPPPVGESSAGAPSPQATGTAAPINPPPAESPDPPTNDAAPIVAPEHPDGPPATTMEVAPPAVTAWRLADAILLLRAEALTDLEATRIANENRLRALRQDYGLTEGPEHDAQAGLVQAIGELEHRAELELKRAVRKHPLGPWIRATQGVGEKQGARLIAAIGDPYWHSVQDRPRLVSELWAYAGLHVLHPGQTRNGDRTMHAGMDQTTVGHAPHGHHRTIADGRPGQAEYDPQSRPAGAHTSASQELSAPHGNSAGGTDSDTSGHPDSERQNACAAGVAPRRQRGQKANWNGAIKMRAYLVAESCIKKRDSPYRPVYETGRTKYTDAVHNHPCARCGPAGKPAQPGSPLSAGHQHARAMRLVMKTILRDLWLEARRLHEDDTP